VGGWPRRPQRLPPRRPPLRRRQLQRPPGRPLIRPSWQSRPRPGRQRQRGLLWNRLGWTPPIPRRRRRWRMLRKQQRTTDIARPPNEPPRDSCRAGRPIRSNEMTVAGQLSIRPGASVWFSPIEWLRASWCESSGHPLDPLNRQDPMRIDARMASSSARSAADVPGMCQVSITSLSPSTLTM
jgi:hypothetical protein